MGAGAGIWLKSLSLLGHELNCGSLGSATRPRTSGNWGNSNSELGRNSSRVNFGTTGAGAEALAGFLGAPGILGAEVAVFTGVEGAGALRGLKGAVRAPSVLGVAAGRSSSDAPGSTSGSQHTEPSAPRPEE